MLSVSDAQGTFVWSRFGHWAELGFSLLSFFIVPLPVTQCFNVAGAYCCIGKPHGLRGSALYVLDAQGTFVWSQYGHGVVLGFSLLFFIFSVSIYPI